MSRRHILAVSMLAVGTLVATAVADQPTRLIWNATASAPIGFYTVAPADTLEIPELVAIAPPEPLEQFMVERGYIGRAAAVRRSPSITSRWAMRWSATAWDAICRSGRAAASSATANSSS